MGAFNLGRVLTYSGYLPCVHIWNTQPLLKGLRLYAVIYRNFQQGVVGIYLRNKHLPGDITPQVVNVLFFQGYFYVD